MKMIEVSEDALESNKKMAEQDAKDAARYRWLRDSENSPIVNEGQATDKMVDRGIAIDAAMQGDKK